MNYNTRKLLRLCKKIGYTKVEIGYKQSKEMPYDYGIYCQPEIRLNNWPAIWNLMQRVPEANFGCGSTNCHQIKWKVLDEGIYDLNQITF